MYHIVKSKTGYQVVAIAGNGEKESSKTGEKIILDYSGIVYIWGA